MTKLLAHLFGWINAAPERQPSTDTAVRRALHHVNAALPAAARFQQGWLHVEPEGTADVTVDLLFLDGDVLHHAVGIVCQGQPTLWHSGPEVPYFGMSQPYGDSSGAPLSWQKPLEEGAQLMTPVLYRKDRLGKAYATEFSHQLVWTSGRLRAVPSEFAPRLIGRKDFPKLSFSFAPPADLVDR
ncbi:hypothetical protein [Deinococcus ruber]|uniref:Uncharacterized protein n=1 Tax=Deinococcus ruber TaxID=1848197 RepID=A0A918CCK1_9DEIO|nr:hypothetical protein [Deinococcus ruber]GGR17418.1 hypothetical protein GCM10008957_32630 [Deinococcus ruber]